MMRRTTLLMASLLFSGLLVACSTDDSSFPSKKMNRVDVLPKEAADSEEPMIIEDHDIQAYRDVLDSINWQPEEMTEVSEPDVKAVLFYELDKGMPERLVEHEIRFAEDGTAEIASNLETERYALLEAPEAETLRQLVEQK